MKKGDTILNAATGKTERVGRMCEMQADDRNELTSAQAGDIIAIVGMKVTFKLVTHYVILKTQSS